MTIGLFVAAALVGYLLGSVPFGLMIGRAFGHKDVRQIGSGKTGMTNVMRAAGKKAAAISLLLDMAKAAAAVFAARAIFGTTAAAAGGVAGWTDTAQALAAVAAICGHNWSVFLGFKGGRGVAAFIGGLLAVYWPAAVVGGGLMLIIGFSTRYMSLGSIVGAVSAFVMTTAFSLLEIDMIVPHPSIQVATYTMVCAIFIYAMHKDNVVRLVSGTERKIGENPKAEVSPSSSHSK
jgi:glycerol-3-phosphate acyltransferase PlsY